jgi:hypothetical protein
LLGLLLTKRDMELCKKGFCVELNNINNSDTIGYLDIQTSVANISSNTNTYLSNYNTLSNSNINFLDSMGDIGIISKDILSNSKEEKEIKILVEDLNNKIKELSITNVENNILNNLDEHYNQIIYKDNEKKSIWDIRR